MLRRSRRSPGCSTRAIAAELRDTARFRNLLVHGYAKVDDTRVVEILRDRVDDLAAFRTALARAAGG